MKVLWELCVASDAVTVTDVAPRVVVMNYAALRVLLQLLLQLL